jgi:hypothetical protein
MTTTDIINNKKCNSCGTYKKYTDFNVAKKHKDGYTYSCKECIKKYRVLNKEKIKDYNNKNKDKYKKYALENKERIKKYKIKYYKENLENIKQYKKKYSSKNFKKIKHERQKYYENNKEKIKKYQKNYKINNKEKIKLRDEKYRKLNKDSIRERAKLYRRRWREDTQNKLNEIMSNAIYKQLKDKSISKNRLEWFKIVNYSAEDLKKHLENLFDENMDWSNYGSYWHIDHIKPKRLFIFNSVHQQEFKDCWALTNLRPLSAKENLQKGGKYSDDYGRVE